ncbi:Uncharacterised protein [Oligella ureolytica]|uniref:Uncharacterized protein n=1 Tax=Oligella ureolytica TaxID=90244 RepID=A0A378XHY4_9BURK|nr:hypothetical protein [Oligella ureolytica]QPT39466.1 hypothetical protein I6G29_09915 [Oligella ureolytica]SUA53130.1 Uncharacterised protein [Oligella ureolytica]SUA56297.1 Uncharacterised protein [Oligella ureolytica]
MPEFESFFSLLPYVKIAHQSAGRVRLKFARDIPKVEMPSLSKAMVNSFIDELPGISKVGFKTFARSLTIEYDSLQIADTAWSDLLNGQQTSAAHDLEAKLRIAYAELQRLVELNNA